MESAETCRTKSKSFSEREQIQAYEALRTPLPESVKAWAQLPGLSESLVAYLYTRLSITTLTDLETAGAIALAPNGPRVLRIGRTRCSRRSTPSTTRVPVIKKRAEAP